jgi:AmmeMemoRadiSam system protein B/AmmeMemoRadiSam system protein A
MAATLLVCGLSSTYVQGINKPEIREPVFAGSFYPGVAVELSGMIDSFLGKVPKKEAKGEIVGLIVPHAGYVFSGQVAANAYKQIEGLKYDTVFIIGPSHRVGISGASVYNGGPFKTPLGVVDIDTSVANSIIASGKQFEFIPKAHAMEHSIEVQLPFLQKTIGNFKIVPIVVNFPSKEIREGLSDAIFISSAGKKVLVVASSDLSHYPDAGDARREDKEVLAAIERFDTGGLLELAGKNVGVVKNLECRMCGDAAIVTVMLACRKMGADEISVLDYANTGDVSGEKSRVVGYGAAVISKGGEAKMRKKPEKLQREEQSASKDTNASEDLFNSATLTEEDKKFLLSFARKAVADYMEDKSSPEEAVKEGLRKKGAVFVTLHKGGKLRGCIGQTQAVVSLIESVKEMAVAAAFHDYRFNPVSRDEMPDIKIEISILSPLQRVKDASLIHLRKHGVVVKRFGRSGLFLPQVAEETGWGKEEFLSQLCSQKAGLPADSWKDPETELYVFTVTSFSE